MSVMLIWVWLFIFLLRHVKMWQCITAQLKVLKSIEQSNRNKFHSQAFCEMVGVFFPLWTAWNNYATDLLKLFWICSLGFCFVGLNFLWTRHLENKWQVFSIYFARQNSHDIYRLSKTFSNEERFCAVVLIQFHWDLVNFIMSFRKYSLYFQLMKLGVK